MIKFGSRTGIYMCVFPCGSLDDNDSLLHFVPIQIASRRTTAEAATLITIKFYLTITITTFTNMINHD